MGESFFVGMFATSLRSPFARNLLNATRCYSSNVSPLKQRLRELVPVQQEKVKNIRKQHGDKVLGSYTVAQVCLYKLLFFFSNLLSGLWWNERNYWFGVRDIFT